jgi:hypothetical protein
VQSARLVDFAPTCGEFGSMTLRQLFALRPQGIGRPRGQQRRAVGAVLPAHHDLAVLETGVLDPHRQGREEAAPASIKKLTDETERRLQPVEERERLTARQHGGEVLGPSSAFEPYPIGQLPVEDATGREDERAERLGLGGGQGPALHCEMVERDRRLGRARIHGVAGVVETDELADPVDTCLLRARRVVQAPRAVRTASMRGWLFSCGRANSRWMEIYRCEPSKVAYDFRPLGRGAGDSSDVCGTRPSLRCDEGPRRSIAGNTWICSRCLLPGIRGYAATGR